MIDKSNFINFQLWFCTNVLNKYHWTPQQWANLNEREKALVVASIELRLEQEEEERKESEREAKS